MNMCMDVFSPCNTQTQCACIVLNFLIVKCVGVITDGCLLYCYHETSKKTVTVRSISGRTSCDACIAVASDNMSWFSLT